MSTTGVSRGTKAKEAPQREGQGPKTQRKKCRSGTGISGGGGKAPLQEALLNRSSRPEEPLPVGPLVDGPLPRRRPDGRMLFGRTVTVEPMNADRHAGALFEAITPGPALDAATIDRIWTYMSVGPWSGLAELREWVISVSASQDPLFYAIVPRATRKAAGVAAYLNIRPETGVLEIGHIWFAPSLQKTREATEAIFLMMRHSFEDLGIRRLEWKCDALNAASRSAARRFGFSFEGVFRKHMIVKGRSRDTAWFSIIDDDWPRLREAFSTWLADGNFDSSGRQKRPLNDFLS